LDDTLFEHFKTLKDWHNREFGTKLTLDDNHPSSQKHWGTPELQKTTLKRWKADSVKEAVLRVQKFFETEEFIEAKPFENSADVIKKLSLNYDIMVVTARDVHLEDMTRRWIERNFDGAIKDVYLTARYNLHGKAKPKTDVLKSLDAKYVIDDNLEICAEAASRGITAILFGDYPWNQADKLSEGVTRAKTWQEVGEYFNERS
jgi:uncharacterized HAD superfamily protein